MKFEDLSKKQIVAILILVLIVLIALNALMESIRNSSDEKVINYKNITGEELINNSTPVYDRTIYLSIEQIVSEYISSYAPSDGGSSYKEYYSMLSKKYKKYLGHKRYEEVSQKFLEKFKDVGAITGQVFIENEKVVNSVYKYDENKYICELKNGRNETAYIGIELDFNTNNGYIFYLE